MKIVITNTKGGVGKTTAAVYLAEALRRSGRKVEVWDADPQGSALAWSDHANDDGTPLGFPVIGIHPRNVARPGGGEAWIIVDTGPNDPSTINAAIRGADLVIIPTGPGGADVDRAVETMRGTPAEVPVLLLLNSYIKTERESWETWRSIQSSDMAAFDIRIPRRAAIQRSYGKPVDELFGFERLLDEVVSVHEHVTQEA